MTRTTQPTTIWTMYNTETRRHEVVHLNEAELLPGETVVQMFWCESGKRYVTVPGASLYTVQADGTLALTRE
jgi:ketosteroid isomerase-like protein